MIDDKLLQSFMKDVEWLRAMQKSSTSAQSSSNSSKRADSAQGQAFAELLAQVEKSANEISAFQPSPLAPQRDGLQAQGDLLPLDFISAPSVPASEVKGWAPGAVWSWVGRGPSVTLKTTV